MTNIKIQIKYPILILAIIVMVLSVSCSRTDSKCEKKCTDSTKVCKDSLMHDTTKVDTVKK